MFDRFLKKRFINANIFSSHDINKSYLLLQKSIYSYKHIDDWEKFNETSLPEKEDFYSHLNMEYITDADYVHTKRMSKDLKIKYFGWYHDLYVQSDTLLLSDVFENFQNTCPEM